MCLRTPVPCRSQKICRCPGRSPSARIVHSHARPHSVSVSVCSIAGLWAPVSAVCASSCMRPAAATTRGSRSRRLDAQWDRLFWVGLSQFWSGWHHTLIFVQPNTVVRWQRERFRRFWARLSRPKGPRRGRPSVASEIRRLIRQVAIANPLWRAPVAQQIVEAFADRETPRYLIRDRDGVSGNEVWSRLKSVGNGEVLTAPQSPGRTPMPSA